MPGSCCCTSAGSEALGRIPWQDEVDECQRQAAGRRVNMLVGERGETEMILLVARRVEDRMIRAALRRQLAGKQHHERSN